MLIKCRSTCCQMEGIYHEQPLMDGWGNSGPFYDHRVSPARLSFLFVLFFGSVCVCVCVCVCGVVLCCVVFVCVCVCLNLFSFSFCFSIFISGNSLVINVVLKGRIIHLPPKSS